jgi:CMP-N-acetylneuraminic acid synthetase
MHEIPKNAKLIIIVDMVNLFTVSVCNELRITMTVQFAALVPIRHHSERVPQKNFRDFAGKPLYSYILTTLSRSSMIDLIVVDTDSENIQRGIQQAFPLVKIIERPAHLTAGDVPMNDVLLHDTQQIDAEFYIQTHCTNPLLQVETIDTALKQFLDHYPVYDSLFGVTRLQSRLWNQLTQPVNHNPNILLRTQDLPPLYEENSNLYVFTRDILHTKHNRIGDRPLMFEINALEAWDIDIEDDFLIAELLYKKRQALS